MPRSNGARSRRERLPKGCVNKLSVSPSTTEQTLREFSEAGRIRIAAADMDGVLRSKYITGAKLKSALEEGAPFCNGVFGWDCADELYDNVSYTGWHTGYPDIRLKLDPATARRLPWEDNTPFLLGEFTESDGTPSAVCPRQLLRHVLARVERAGFQVQAGMEFEWYNFAETPQSLEQKEYHSPQPIWPGMFGYSAIRYAQHHTYLKSLLEQLPAFGIPIEGLHSENGPGILEAAIHYTTGMEAADRAALFKTAVKEIAARCGVMPSFMAKWHASYQGCSAHCHQSLTDGQKNLFYDAESASGMNRLFDSYVAGQLHCLPYLTPMFAPTVNSYKRLVDGFWAPVRTDWGFDNRTASLRVIVAGPKATRVETRLPGADVNPYLSLAACVAAGFYGIENELRLEQPPVGATSSPTGERLPRNLQEATCRFAEHELPKELFGEQFVAHFAATREWEWRRFHDAITDWELKRYFEVI